MKHFLAPFLRFLSILLCLQFIVGPMDIKLIGQVHAQSTDCSQYPGTEWNVDAGACKATENAQKVESALRNCTDAECMIKNGEGQLADEEKKGNVNASEQNALGFNALGTTMSSAVVVITGFYIYKALSTHASKSFCTAPSLLFLFGGGVLLFAGEVHTLISHYMNLADIEERRKNVGKDSEGKQLQGAALQSAAFGFLAENEDSLANVADTKFKYYLASTILFGAGLVAAGIETIVINTTTDPATKKWLTCNEKSEKASKEEQENEAKQKEADQKEAAEKQERGERQKKIEENGKTIEEKDKAAQDKSLEADKHSKDAEYHKTREKEINEQLKDEKLPESERKRLEAEASDHRYKANQSTNAGEQATKDANKASEQADNLRKENFNESMKQEDSTNTPRNDPPPGRPIPQDDGAQQQVYNLNPFEAEIQKLTKLSEKKVALKNISTSRNMYELIELTKEFQSIEFSNYSQNFIPEDHNVLKELKADSIDLDISSLIAMTFGIADAHANSSLDQYAPTLPDENGNFTSSGSPTKTPPTEPELGAPVKEIDFNAPENNQGPDHDTELRAAAEGNAGDATKEAAAKATETLANGPADNMTGEDGKQLSNQAAGDVQEWIGYPWFRAIGNGVMGTLTGILAKIMSDAHETHKARAEKLRQIQADFDNYKATTTCTPEERNSPSNPNCYCITEDMKKNPSRANSKACLALFGPTKEYKPRKYSNSSTSRVCVDKSKGADPSCECKKKKGKDGRNTCMKVSMGQKMNGFDAGSFKMLNGAAAPANDLMNGLVSPAGLNAAALERNAANLRNIAKKVLSKNPKLFANLDKVTKKKTLAMLDRTKRMNIASRPFASTSDLAKMTPAQAQAALEKELEKKNPATGKPSGGGGSAAAPTHVDTPEFGLTEQGAANQEKEISQVMKKDYNLNDINKLKSDNIFEVLSNRYHRSGMRRLFDDEGKTQADKPSETDINK